MNRSPPEAQGEDTVRGGSERPFFSTAIGRQGEQHQRCRDVAARPISAWNGPDSTVCPAYMTVTSIAGVGHGRPKYGSTNSIEGPRGFGEASRQQLEDWQCVPIRGAG